MILALLLLSVGLAALLAGGDTLVRGASALALRMGVAPVIVGLTVVAFGTSTPELVVNLAAAFRGTPELGFGNVVGSNIANLGLLLGGTALLVPLAVNRSLMVREIPLMAGVAVFSVVLGVVAGAGFSRWEGACLLVLLAAFLAVTVREAIRGRGDRFVDGASQTAERRFHPEDRGAGPALVLVILGLILLGVGGEVAVRGATAVAAAAGVPETVIGLTVLAVGTSLPELATSMVAAVRGEADVALGNLVGSNLFNLLCVWGITVVLEPSPLPPGGGGDLLVMAGFSLAIVPTAWSGRTVGRVEGALLLSAYAGYIAWIAVR